MLTAEHTADKSQLPPAIHAELPDAINAPPRGERTSTPPHAALREARVDRIMDAYAARSLFDTFALQPRTTTAEPSPSPNPGAPGARRFSAAVATASPENTSETPHITPSIPPGTIEALLRDVFDIKLDAPLDLAQMLDGFDPYPGGGTRSPELKLGDVEEFLLHAVR